MPTERGTEMKLFGARNYPTTLSFNHGRNSGQKIRLVVYFDTNLPKWIDGLTYGCGTVAQSIQKVVDGKTGRARRLQEDLEFPCQLCCPLRHPPRLLCMHVPLPPPRPPPPGAARGRVWREVSLRHVTAWLVL